MSKLTLRQLDAGIEAAMANAKSLIEEAALLLGSGFHARAYTLSHIAREELAKVTMLYAAGMKTLAEHPVDWNKLQKRLRDHSSKLTNDAIFLYANTPKASETLSLELMVTGTKTRNEWKNDSLYIALKDQDFKTPAQLITPRKAERTIALARLIFEDNIHYLSKGGKLAERNAKSVKEIFGVMGNPSEMNWKEMKSQVEQLSQIIHKQAPDLKNENSQPSFDTQANASTSEK